MLVFMQRKTQKFYVGNLRNSGDVKKQPAFQEMQTLQVNNSKNSYDKKYKNVQGIMFI